MSDSESNLPFARIVSQPASVYKMRYKGDRKTSSSLYSESKDSNVDNKYPKIQLVNATGPATLFVLCVSTTEPHYVHPHRLIGDKCKSGVAVFHIGKDETIFELNNLNIEYTRSTDLDQRLVELKAQNIDPFSAGFDFDPASIDFKTFRLCFLVYLCEWLDLIHLRPDHGLKSLAPIVSNTISNLVIKPRLHIVRTENMYSPASGGKTVVIFLKKLEKDQRNLCAKFDDKSGWSKIVKISENLIHYRCAVTFNAPKYKQTDIKSNVAVSLKLYVPFANEKERHEFSQEQKSNEECEDDEDKDDNQMPDVKYQSKSLDFQYTPIVHFVKQKLNLSSFFSFVDKDSEVTSEVNQICRAKLAKRTVELLYENSDNEGLTNIGTGLFQNDSVSINHIIKYTNDLDLASANEVELNNEENLLILNRIRKVLDSNYESKANQSEENVNSTKNIEDPKSNSDFQPTNRNAELGINKSWLNLQESGNDDGSRVFFEKLFNF